jgi:hypothetical protein
MKRGREREQSLRMQRQEYDLQHEASLYKVNMCTPQDTEFCMTSVTFTSLTYTTMPTERNC